MKSKHLIIGLLSLVSTFFSLTALALTGYQIIEIGNFSPTSINDTGQVVGYSGAGYGQRPGIYYNAGSLKELEPIWSGLLHINNNGLVLACCVSDTGNKQSYLWDSNTNTYTTLSFQGYGLNDFNTVVGDGSVMWTNGVYTELGIPWTDHGAWDINNTGQVVGQWYGGSGYLWENGNYQYIGGVSTDINNNGTILFIGWSATIYNNGTYTSLKDIFPTAINDANEVVGYTQYNEYGDIHAALWRNGMTIDLNELIDPLSGWELFNATGINSSGMIVGYGVNKLGQNRGFILTPVPEAETYAMFFTGLMLISSITRKRKT